MQTGVPASTIAAMSPFAPSRPTLIATLTLPTGVMLPPRPPLAR